MVKTRRNSVVREAWGLWKEDPQISEYRLRLPLFIGLSAQFCLGQGMGGGYSLSCDCLKKYSGPTLSKDAHIFGVIVQISSTRRPPPISILGRRFATTATLSIECTIFRHVNYSRNTDVKSYWLRQAQYTHSGNSEMGDNNKKREDSTKHN